MIWRASWSWCEGARSTIGASRRAQFGMTDPHILVDPAPATLEHVQWNVLMNFKAPRRPQFFYTTAPLPCPYVTGRTERKVVTEIAGAGTEALHDRLSRAGFRRSHNIAY